LTAILVLDHGGAEKKGASTAPELRHRTFTFEKVSTFSSSF
jgi:hypothetical protein